MVYKGNDKILDQISIDYVIFGIKDKELSFLAIKRDLKPFHDQLALPGGWIKKDESLDAAAKRNLEELTGLKNIYLQQFRTFGDSDRFPGKRILTISYLALVDPRKFDKSNVNLEWLSAGKKTKLPFDHNQILKLARKVLQEKVLMEPIAFKLVPRKFTISQLQSVYEVIMDKKLDNRNFRKKLHKLECIKRLDEKQTQVAHRAASLYSFDQKRYKETGDGEILFNF